MILALLLIQAAPAIEQVETIAGWRIRRIEGSCAISKSFGAKASVSITKLARQPKATVFLTDNTLSPMHFGKVIATGDQYFNMVFVKGDTVDVSWGKVGGPILNLGTSQFVVGLDYKRLASKLAGAEVWGFEQNGSPVASFPLGDLAKALPAMNRCVTAISTSVHGKATNASPPPPRPR